MAASEDSKSRVEAVTRQLREDIFHGRFPPGTPLRELALARELRVSQATIRESLRRLEHAGLISKEVNRGSTVTRLSGKDIRERVGLRALLEVNAALAAAASMRPENFDELERRLSVLDSTIQSDKYYESAQADLEFHRYVWQCSGNGTLCHLLELITVPLFAFISILRSQGVQRLATVVAPHEPLITALRGGDRDAIREAFIANATSAYRSFLEPGDDQALATALGILEATEMAKASGMPGM